MKSSFKLTRGQFMIAALRLVRKAAHQGSFFLQGIARHVGIFRVIGILNQDGSTAGLDGAQTGRADHNNIVSIGWKNSCVSV